MEKGEWKVQNCAIAYCRTSKEART